MSIINNTVIDDINDLLFTSNEALATKIYDAYVNKVETKAFIMSVLINCMHQDKVINMSDIIYNDLHNSIEEYVKYETNCSGVETEAIKHWLRYSTVDVKYSVEAITGEINSVYQGFKQIVSKSSIAHYCNADNYIDRMTDQDIYLVAIEYLIEGIRNGVTGQKYFDAMTKDMTIVPTIREKFKTIFDREGYYNQTCELSNLVFSMERFFANDAIVDKKVKDAKCYDKKAFIKQLKEADVLVLYRQLKFVPFIGKLTNKINQFVTGSSFMSIKLVGKDCKTVIGFGAKISNEVNAMKCQEVPIEYIVDTCAGIVAIRHTDIKQKHVDYILDYARRVMLYNSEYNFVDLLKSAFTHKSESINGPAKLLTKEEAKNYFSPMICTTLITAAYRGAGLEPGVNFSDKTAWPIDVLKSDKFKAVATYFIPEEKPLIFNN